MADDDARENIPEEDGAASDNGGSRHIPDDVAAALVETFDTAEFHDSHGQPVVYLDRADWLEAATLLRDEHQFTQCVDVTAVDHLADETRHFVHHVQPERFEVVANFLSHEQNRRIRLIAELPADDPSVASLTEVFPGVNFAERETYDLLGVEFEGHPDLTRLLMPDDWVGHPLRKDDPPSHVPVTFKEDPGPR